MQGTKRYRNGAWRLQVYAGRDDLTGRRRQITATFRAPNTKAGGKEADAALRRLVDKVEATSAHVRHDLTVAELLERWYHFRSPDWAPKTCKENRQVIDQRITPRIGARKVQQLRPIEIDAFYAELRQRGGRKGQPIKASTVLKAHVVLHAALAQAVDWQIIAANPAHRRRPEVEPTDIAPATEDQVTRAMAALATNDPLFHLYVCLAAVTGARRGTLLALRWANFDLEAGTVRLARSISDGGAAHGGLVERVGSKSRKIITISLDPGTIALLTTARRAHVERCLAAGTAADGYIFGTGKGPSWHPGTVSRKWALMRKEAGIGNVQLKNVRHYVATSMLADGEDVVTAAGRLGHDPAVMLRVYAAWLPEKDRAAADRLGARLHGVDAGANRPRALPNGS